MDIYKLNFTILERDIFSLLCVKAGEKLSQRDLAKLLNVSPTAIGNSLIKLKEFIKIEKTKTINFISLNRNNAEVIQLKRVENLKNIYLSGLADFLEEKFPGSTIVVFGSYSRGEDVCSSDVDIAIIDGKDKLLKMEIFEKILERQININFYNSWKDIHKHLRNNVLSGIILSGGVDL